MENTAGSPKKREKKGLFMKTIKRWRSFGGDQSSEMKNRSKSNPSSPRPGFWNRSKSTSNASFHGSTSTKKMEKRSLFTMNFQRSQSLGSDIKTQPKLNPTSPLPSFLRRSKSTSRDSSNRVVPAGCFTVHVGPNKERFVVKTACLNHPLFHELLQEAEHEFGFASEGPIILPCDVELFREVMLEMEQQSSPVKSPICNFSKSPYSDIYQNM
ncbi:SAUR-like auxin-responsive family protein [Rhynchospora pubera]|uniref:SAUR-like auxin-responsive family protein n=1 Tax=Rhynchospora pubera TaxID=906938 RepID=A0AAV8D6B4_9POAL|nr:SAUR-like auxin-responsive family protein [Rhynchospora pubera]